MTIERSGSGEHYTVTSGNESLQPYMITFTATELKAEWPHAIVELQITASTETTVRRIVFATVTQDELRVWSINSKRLGELLYSQNAPAVIEHSFLSSRVRCEPNILLKVLQANTKELMGEMRRFERIVSNSK